MEYSYPLCEGFNCCRKTLCRHFKRDIDKKKEDHFAWPPLKEDGSCREFKEREPDPVIEKLREIFKDGRDD